MAIVETFHYARPDEVHALEELQRRASMEREELRQRLSDAPDSVRISVAAVRDQRVRVAVGEETILGFSTVLPIDRRASRLDALWVEPMFSDQGVDLALVDDLVAIAADESIVRLEVIAAVWQVDFYQSAGFVRHESFDGQHGPLVRMVREL